MLRAKDSSLTAQSSITFPVAVFGTIGPSIRKLRLSLRNWLSFPTNTRHINRIAGPLLFMSLVLLLYTINSNALLLAQEQNPLETRASDLDKQIMCPVCPGETLHQSQVTLAKQMKQIIRNRLAAGESEDAILDYFVSVYGESILASPPKRGLWLIAWVTPFIALVLGAIIVVLFAKSLKRPVAIAESESPDSDP
jgi:cytochrome c-type biogenesis protein CcmH